MYNQKYVILFDYAKVFVSKTDCFVGTIYMGSQTWNGDTLISSLDFTTKFSIHLISVVRKFVNYNMVITNY